MQDVPENVLFWDADSKEQSVGADVPETRFSFTVSNISTTDVLLLKATASCGCTVPQLPTDPKIPPGGSRQIDVVMNLQGKFSKVSKTVTINTDQGVKVLYVTANLPTPTLRDIRREIAKTDRQAVFKGDCRKCHVEPAQDKQGEPLFAAACGICHTAETRAAMVPDLRALNHPTDAEFWRNTIRYGKPGTLMPAFAQTEGGILDDAQIASLVDYLSAVAK